MAMDVPAAKWVEVANMVNTVEVRWAPVRSMEDSTAAVKWAPALSTDKVVVKWVMDLSRANTAVAAAVVV